MSRLRVAAPALLALSMFVLVPGRAAAASRPVVDVIVAKGMIDPALSDFVRGAIESSERDGATVVLQLDSLGGYDQEAVRLGEFIHRATVPVIAWVGPSGARAEGGALFLVYSSSLATMAPGAGVGPARPFDAGSSVGTEPDAPALAQRLVSLAPGAGATEQGARLVVEGPSLPAGPALGRGAVAVVAADLCDLLRQVQGKQVRTGSGLTTVPAGACPSGSVARFHDMGPVRKVLHTVATPTAVYVLLVLGVWLLAFELTQPGLGVAGIGGALSLAFAGYGLAVIPIHWVGLSLLLAGMGLQGGDILIGKLGVLTALGTAAFAAGSILAWRGVSPAIDLAPWLIVLATLGSFLFFGFGMTVALRAKQRIRTAQVGLVGMTGEVRSDLNPEGGVFVKGTVWRARSTDGPIPKGARVRVKGIDGLVLRVEEESE